MFNTKRRLASAWAKGLMLGKAVGARDERDRILSKLKNTLLNTTDEFDVELKEGYQMAIWLIESESND